MPGRLRAADWILIAALVAAFVLLLGAGVGGDATLRNGWLPLQLASARAAGAYPTVRGILPETPPGVEVGDELRTVGGEDLRGRSALYFYDRAHRAARDRGAASVGLARAGKALEIALPLERTRVWWLALPFAVALLGTALALWILAPRWHLARRYFVACWCFAALAASGTGPHPFSIPAGVLILLLSPIGAALTVWNAAEFTLSARPVPLALRALAVGSGGLFAAMWSVVLLLPGSAATEAAFRAAYSLSFAGGTLAGLTRAYVRSSPVERRQVRWVLLGFYVAMTGFVALGPSRGSGQRLQPSAPVSPSPPRSSSP